MTDDPSDRRRSRSGGDSSAEWIERIAESEGISPDEVVEQLVSSYWTLKEMHGLMEQSDEGIDADELPLDVERLYSDAFAEDVEAINDRLDRLEATVEEREVDSGVAEVSARVEMLAQRIAAVEETLSSRQDTLRSRLDEEFGNLETILDYLIESTDDLERDVESVIEKQATDRAHRDEQSRLVELKRLASRLGIRSAKCEYCDATVDIALLPTPDCPQCDRHFTDIQPSTGWFGFGSDVLTVTGEPYLEETDQPGEGSDDRRESAESSGETERFRWGESRE